MSYASGIRTYMKARIGECFPDYEEWSDYLNFDNIPSQVIDCRYHIEIGSTTSSTDDRATEDSTSVIVRFFKKSQNSEAILEDYDELYDCVHAFKVNAQDPSKYTNVNFLRVLSTGITPSSLDESNDNLIQMEIEFNIISYYEC